MLDYFRLRPITGVCIVGGVILGLLLPSTLRISTRALIAWDAAVAVFIIVMTVTMWRTDLDKLRQRAIALDGGRAFILVLTLIGAAMSVAAIVGELAEASSPDGYSVAVIVLTVATIALSWTFMHLMFALHYAHEYYAPDDGGPPDALKFPGEEDPLYGDFTHFAFVIGCASQTADIAIASRAMRRVVTAHCVAAFVFNTLIVALTINVAASLIGK